jgi:hypothetical protein
MCNPRRIVVTATRDLSEAWQHEVARTVRMTGRAVGSARIRQPIGASLGTPARRALDAAFATGIPGWTAVDEGFRHEVEGGYVVYHPDDQTLEIVATCETEIAVEGRAAQQIRGVVQGAIRAEGVSTIYDDGWGGRTEAVGHNEATARANELLDRERQKKLEEARRDAEAGIANAVEGSARDAAAANLQNEAARREAELARQATARLDAVGARCRAAFHDVLARAYRDALLAYARRQNAEVVECRDENGVLSVELRVRG